MRRILPVFLIFYIGITIAAFFVGSRFSWVLMYLLSGVLMVAMLHAIIVRFIVRIHVSAPAITVVTGEAVPILVTLSTSLLPLPSLALHFQHYDQVAQQSVLYAHTRPWAEQTFTNVAIMRCRGLYALGVSHYCAPDYFGLLINRCRLRKRCIITVLPRVHDVSPFAAALQIPSELHTTPKRGSTRQADIAGIRPYADGDTMRDIHWKLSAKTSDLVVKQHEYSRINPVVILLDMTAIVGASAAETENQVLETALSLAAYCMKHNAVSVFVITDTVRHFPLTQADEFDELYQLIGVAPFAGTPTALTMEALTFEANATVWLISGQATETILQPMTQWMGYASQCGFWYIEGSTPATFDAVRHLHMFQAAGGLVHTIAPDQTIQSVLEGLL